MKICNDERLLWVVSGPSSAYHATGSSDPDSGRSPSVYIGSKADIR